MAGHRRPTRFTFQPRWKEELLCSHAGGTFVLPMPMGLPCVYLPTEAAWAREAPVGLASAWSDLQGDLAAWCASNGVPLHVQDPPYGME